MDDDKVTSFEWALCDETYLDDDAVVLRDLCYAAGERALGTLEGRAWTVGNAATGASWRRGCDKDGRRDQRDRERAEGQPC